MTLDRLGMPFQGSAWYWIEDSYGVVTDCSLNSLPISCKIQNIRLDTGDRHKVLRDIGSPFACHLLKQIHEPKVHLEYIPQAGDTLIDDAIDRSGSCCSLQSITMCIGANTCEFTVDSDDGSWYLASGMKPATIRVTGSKNTEYLIVIDYEARSIVTCSSVNCACTSSPTPLSGDYLQFNVAGEIRKTNSALGLFHVVNADHIAFVTNSVELTITHKLTGYTDHDQLYKSYLIEGETDIEGSVDITLDGGGARHVSEVLNNRSFDLTIDMGLIGAAGNVPRITLPNCEWKNTSVNQDTGGEAMMNSSPFTCKPDSTCSATQGMNIVTFPTA